MQLHKSGLVRYVLGLSLLASSVSLAHAQNAGTSIKADLPDLLDNLTVMNVPEIQGPLALLDVTSDNRKQADLEQAEAIENALSVRAKGLHPLEKRDLTALKAYYKANEHQLLWFEKGALNSQALALKEALADAANEGLDPADYPFPDEVELASKSNNIDELAKADVELSRTLARYVRHAYAGRVDPRLFSKKEVTIKPHYPDAAKALERLKDAEDPAKMLRSYHPQHKGYLALKAEYNRLRLEDEQEDLPPIPKGKSLRKGMKDPRVPLLRQRLALAALDESDEGAHLYGAQEIEAVKQFQKQNGLTADGIVGPATLSILNNDRKGLLEDMIANLERWRWLPRDLGQFHVLVNIPTFHVQVVNKDQTIHKTRVVVGKTKHKTPVFFRSDGICCGQSLLECAPVHHQ